MNYIIYDLEATCWEGSRWEEMEIIEIGLREAMRKLSMPFDGRLHRGIDDARNIAAVAQTILMLDE